MIRALLTLWRVLRNRCERCGAPSSVLVRVHRSDGTEYRCELMCATCAVTTYPPEVMEWAPHVNR
jgi:hypothetical protein